MATVIRKLLLLAIFSTVVSLCAVGCIPVEDLGEYWNKGTIDSELEGHWKKTGAEFQSEDNYISFIKVNDHYKVKSAGAYMPMPMEEAPEQICKTLNTGNHKFLMFNVEEYFKAAYEASRKAAEKMAEQMGEEFDKSALENIMPKQEIPFKGALQRYTVENDVLALYMLNDEVLAEQIKKGNVKGRSPAHNQMMGATISKLDSKTIQFLANLADESKYWDQVERFERIDDLEKALEESRKYPATKDTPKNTLINIDLPDLKYFAEGKTHILLQHLQASPEWKVFIEGQRMVCHRRKKQSGRWNDGSNSFHHDFLDEYSKSEDDWFPIDAMDRAAPMNERNWQQMAYLFRFEQEPYGYHPTWAGQPHVMKISPLEGEINIKLKASDQGIESYMAIGQPGLWFEVFEQTWHEPRKKTRNALKLLKKFLRGIREAEEEILNQGYASQFMPSGGVKKGKPTLEVKWDHGIYSARAWVNPGQQGYVFVRVFNIDTREYLPERLTGLPLKEYIGFSKDPTTLFSYNCRLYVRGDQLKQSFNAKFELWLHPSDGSPDRKLISAIDKILPDSERTIDTSRSGKVIDKSGVPINDARVILYGAKKPAKGRPLPFECKVLETTTTNESGIFTITMKQPYKGRSLDFDRLFVVVQKDGFALGTQYFHSLEESEDKVITLSKSTTIAGTVINQNGDPIIGAEVHVFPIKGRWEDGNLIGLLSSTDLSTTNTDRYGRFLLDHIPIEAYAEFYVIAEGYLDKFTSHDLGGRTDKGKFEAGAPDVVLKMEVKSGFTGRVVDKDTGLPVKTLKVSFRPQVPKDDLVNSVSTVTDEKGFYSMYCPPGKYIFHYAYPYTAVGQEIIVTEGQVTSNVDLQVYMLGDLYIKVSQIETGKPVVDVDITIKNEKTGKRHPLRTGEKGAVLFSRPAGQYVIEQISKYGEELLDTPESITIKPGHREEREFKFDVTAEGKGMLVVVTDASKKPVPGVNIYLLPGNRFLGQTDEAGKSKILKEDFKEAVLAAFGQEYFERYGTHREFYIYAQDAENNMAKIHMFYSRSSGLVEIVLSDTFEIWGRVVDTTTGQPIAHALVFPSVFLKHHKRNYFELGDERDFITNSEGFYKFRALPHGNRYTVTATADGFGQSKVMVYTGTEGRRVLKNWMSRRPIPKIKPNVVESKANKIELKDFVLQEVGLSISGVVVDTMGKPISNAKVSFIDVRDEFKAVKTGPNADFEPFTTGPDGKFRFDGLSKGKLKLTVLSEWSPGRFPSAHEFYNVNINIEAGNEEMRIIMTPKKAVTEIPKGPFVDGGLVEVFVADSNTTEPLENASVVFQGENITNGATSYTNKQGLAYIVLPSGTYTLTGIGGRKDYRSRKVNSQIEVEPRQTCIRDVKLNHKAGFEGIVVDQQDQPVGGAFFELIPFHTDKYDFTTKADGKFSVAFEPTSIHLRHADGPPCWIIIHKRRKLGAYLRRTKGYKKNVRIVLRPAIRIIGKVTDEDRIPTKATVEIVPRHKKYKSKGDRFGKVTSNEQGLYEILVPPELPADYTYTLNFWANGTSVQSYSIDTKDKTDGQIIIKDVIIKGTVVRPRRLR